MSRVGPTAWLDLTAAVAASVLIGSLAMIWYRVQSCPLFSECGPWEARSGWVEAGPVVLLAVAVAGAVYLFVRHAAARRFLAASVFAAVAFVLRMDATIRINVFTNEEGPLAGHYIGFAAALVAALALVASATWAATGGAQETGQAPAQSP